LLNRRPGSVIIEPAWSHRPFRHRPAGVVAPRCGSRAFGSPLCLGTTCRLEIGPLAGVAYDGDQVNVSIGTDGHPSTTHGRDRHQPRPGERVRSHRCLGGHRLVAKGTRAWPWAGGDRREIRITDPPPGNYVRLGSTPGPRVFRTSCGVRPVQPGRRRPGLHLDPPRHRPKARALRRHRRRVTDLAQIDAAASRTAAVVAVTLR